MTRPRHNQRSVRQTLARGVAVGLIAGTLAAPQFGCGREFFRQWADQDVSEAVFEKSRDPRWRIDAFTIEPPGMSRYANPYDIDRPPAPPDDHATEALSPTPQWAHHKLLVPQEGTGYLDIMDKGPRYQAPPPYVKKETVVPPVMPIQETPPESDTPSPFNPPENSGTSPSEMSPNTLPVKPVDNPKAPATPPDSSPPQARKSPKDTGVILSAFQSPTLPATLPDPGQVPATAPGGVSGTPADRPQTPPDRIQSPNIDLDPNPSGVDVNKPPVFQSDQTAEDRAKSKAAAAIFLELLTPQLRDFNEALAAGFPAQSRPYVVNPAQAVQLALINNRAYQFQLETVYTSALTATLARFRFQPQFYAGMSPTTGTNGGGSPINPQNSFQYRTKETIGGQNSVVNMGTVAGVGKLFSFGGQLVAGYANQTIFNFLGNNPRQPTVTSFLPITFAQQFLKGGGRAVTLEPLTQVERTLIYDVRNLARLRQTFIPFVLTQNQALAGGGGPQDPNPGFLNVLFTIQNVENSRRTVASFEAVLLLYQQYALNSGASGISQIQVDQIAQNLQSQRTTLLSNEAQYKSTLDNFKVQLGLPPDTPLILDRSVTSSFRNVFTAIDRWFADPDHDPIQLNGIIEGLPELESIVIDGRELFTYDESNRLTQKFAVPEKQQEFLLACERIALENRLDLMNARAQLYDAWRQLAVTANGLKGVFNLNVTNTITTPTASSNPFGFLDQAKQFSIVMNTELPLVRVAERNAYRLATITYNRQQRTLMNAEDNIKLAVRTQVYQLINQAESYEVQKTNLLLTVRQRDLSLQQIIAPPASSAGGGNDAAQAQQTVNFIQSINGTLQIQTQLLQQWISFQTQRLSLYRDLGLLPYDEWEAFYEFFPADSSTSDGPGANGASGGQPSASRPANAAA